MPVDRVALFVDGQNFYNSARRAFFNAGSDGHVAGQFNPLNLARLICNRGPSGRERALQQVRVYTGRPDSEKDPRTYGAHRNQCAAWEAAEVKVITRTLRYPRQWPKEKAQEKGIDVALAIDFVTLALDKKFDVGVIASTDNDLRPAIEFVVSRPSCSCRAEVAAWKGDVQSSRLSVPGKGIWCHWLSRSDYDSVADPRNYSTGGA